MNEYKPLTASQTSAKYNEAVELLEKARNIILTLWDDAPNGTQDDDALNLAQQHTNTAERLLKTAGETARARFQRQANK